MHSVNENNNTNFNSLTLLCEVIKGVSKSNASFVKLPSKSALKYWTSFATANQDYSIKYPHETEIKKILSQCAQDNLFIHNGFCKFLHQKCGLNNKYESNAVKLLRNNDSELCFKVILRDCY